MSRTKNWNLSHVWQGGRHIHESLNGSPTSLNERQGSKCAPGHSRTGLETGKMYRRQLQGLSMRMASLWLSTMEHLCAETTDLLPRGGWQGTGSLYIPQRLRSTFKGGEYSGLIFHLRRCGKGKRYCRDACNEHA